MRNGERMLECKICGNTKEFYLKEKFSGETEIAIDNHGERIDCNCEIYDSATYKLKSVYYFCRNCDAKVAKIPKDKRY